MLREHYNELIVLTGASLLGLTAGVVGCFAVLRKRSLLGDALGHATLPGLCLGFFAGAGVLVLMLSLFPNPPEWFTGVFFAVLLGGMLLGAYAGYRVARRFFGPSR